MISIFVLTIWTHVIAMTTVRMWPGLYMNVRNVDFISTHRGFVLHIPSSAHTGTFFVRVVVWDLFIAKLLPVPILPLVYNLFTTNSVIKQWLKLKMFFDIGLSKTLSWIRRLTMNHRGTLLTHCWQRSASPYVVIKPWWVNSLRPRQNGRLFADDIFECIFWNENVWISIRISLKFFSKGLINNIPVLVQIRAWRRLGDKPLSEAMMVNLPTHICVSRPRWVKFS